MACKMEFAHAALACGQLSQLVFHSLKVTGWVFHSLKVISPCLKGLVTEGKPAG